MAFRFKHFTVEDDRSTLKVGTDAMLLGAWADPGSVRTILDIGTGCGVLALMMAQKSNALIDAIDIDQPSVDQARENFGKSQWQGRLTANRCSLVDFQPLSGDLYDFIVSNPPYFKNQLKSGSNKVNITKHDEGLSVETLIKMIPPILSPIGRLAVVFPYENHLFFIKVCKDYGFHLSRQLNIHSKPGISAGRTLMEFNRSVNKYPMTTSLIILNDHGIYTDDYLTLTADFHCF